MKFRGKLVDIGCIQHFTRVITTISKLAKTCTLRITSHKLYFILTEQVANGGVRIWCELVQGNFFDEYDMEGVNKEEANEIYLELIPENLARSLRNVVQLAKSVKIKLTKKHTPCLTLEIELPSLTGHSRIVLHDVPVSVIPRRLWGDFEEPEMPNFDVSICLPQLKILRNVVDRMKAMSNSVIIAANQNGELALKVHTDMVNVTTHFKDLSNPSWSDEHGDGASQKTTVMGSGKSKFAEAKVDIRRFAQFLAGQQVNPTKVICNIVNEKVIHFFLLHDDLSLQYFIPAVY